MNANPVIEGLTARAGKGGKPALCLVTGANGYIGGRLVPELLAMGYRVRVLARNASRISQHAWANQVEVVDGDAADEKVLHKALAEVDVAYYLIHSLMLKSNFEEDEINNAKLFADAAKQKVVSRIIYLGGIINDDHDLSPHMSARAGTGEVLRNSGIPTIELRAGVVIGSGFD